MKQATYSQRSITFFILLIMLVMPFAMDEYTPSLPHMARALQTTANMIQLTMPVFLLSLAVAQPIFGAIADHRGRRFALNLSMSIFLIGSIICIFANSISVILLGRLIQGFGAGAPNITPPILIGDAVEQDNIPKVTSYYILGYSLIPVVAPVLGGYLQDWFNWQANFIFIFLLGLIVALICFFKLPETHAHHDEGPFSFAGLAQKYKRVLSNMTYTGCAVSAFLTWAPIVVFSLTAPFILQNELGMSAASYGHLAMMVGVGFLVGNSVNTWLTNRNTPLTKIIRFGFGLWLITSIIQVIAMLLGFFNTYTIVIPIFVLMLGVSMAFPAVYATALAASDLPSVAGSVINTIAILGVSIITAIVSRLHVHSGTVFAGMYLALCLAAIGMYWLSAKK